MNGGSATGATEGNAQAFSLAGSRFMPPVRSHVSGLGIRGEMTAYWLFAAYAVTVELLATGQDALWAAWAVPAYGVAAVMMPRSRGWGVALLTAAFAVGAPLLLLLAEGGELSAGMAVIERSAALLVKDGTPYLPSWQLSSWLAYNPYLPAMALFGLPSAAGLRGAPGNPQVWLVLVTVAALAAAFRTLAPHSVRDCADCRRDVLRYTAFAAACPVMALNLAVTTTDPPVLALMLLALALIARPERWASSAAALGLAGAMKPTAWLAIPVIAAMLRSRDGTGMAVRFTATSVAFIVAATVPALIASPVAMVQNTVLFPLGLTRHLTPAGSLVPGDLLARTGGAGHGIAAGLLLVAGVAIAVSLIVRPPGDLRAATWRLAVGLALMFALGPAERFGYFIYPLGLAGWLVITRRTARSLTASWCVVEQLHLGDVPADPGSPRPATGYEIERELAAAGLASVAGVDEVGRGAWAGPVVVCAVVVRPGFPGPPDGLTDSKRLTPQRRAALAGELPGWVASYAIGAASHDEIDERGMTAALRAAALMALGQLPDRPDAVLLDGSHDYIGRPWPVRCAVKADLRSVSVAAASVIAKVYRDRLMAGLGEQPACAGFAFDENAGYPSPAHQQALAAHGPTPYHRLSWSYLDDLPQWRHLKKPRPDIAGQLSLL